MADDRRRRFSQIERPRRPGEPAPDQTPGTSTRFGAVGEPARPEDPAAAPEAAPPAAPTPAAGDGAAAEPFGVAEPPGQAPVAPGHTDRFRPAAARPIEVEERGAETQPFVRCCRCETDASRFAARCTTCGAELDTDEQRAFNERLWSQRRTEAAQEAEAHAAREAGLAEERAREAVARRELHEAMAREVGERERWRYDREVSGEPSFGPPSGSWGGSAGGTWGQDDRSAPGGGLLTPGLPLGLRLLGLIPQPGLRVAAGVAAVAVPALLFLVYPGAGLLVGAVVLGLFTPGGFWRRRRRW